LAGAVSRVGARVRSVFTAYKCRRTGWSCTGRPGPWRCRSFRT